MTTAYGFSLPPLLFSVTRARPLEVAPCAPWAAPPRVSPLPYAGTLAFTVGHSEYNSLGLGAQEECDIILESAATNISLCHRKVCSNLPAHASVLPLPRRSSPPGSLRAKMWWSSAMMVAGSTPTLRRCCLRACLSRIQIVDSSRVAARVPLGRAALPVLSLRPSYPRLALLRPRALLHQGRVNEQGRQAGSCLDPQRPLHRRALRACPPPSTYSSLLNTAVLFDVYRCLQASMKLPIFACEEFGVHVAKYMQKVLMRAQATPACSDAHCS